MRSILIVDGDEYSRVYLREMLKKEGYKVYYSDKGREGLEKAREKLPDLIICEQVFIDIEGTEIIREIRSNQNTMRIPFMVLSKKSDEIDKVLALELGADDYVVKPYCDKELLARIKAQFRYERKKDGNETHTEEILQKCGDIILIPSESEILVNGDRIFLSSKELKILNIFINSKNNSARRSEIIQKVWGNNLENQPQLLDAYLSNIQQKINEKSIFEFSIEFCGKSEYRMVMKEKPAEI